MKILYTDELLSPKIVNLDSITWNPRQSSRIWSG
jgi:hypothetical protein